MGGGQQGLVWARQGLVFRVGLNICEIDNKNIYDQFYQ
jgi:hypothetical protein